jgi:hypothetical protein
MLATVALVACVLAALQRSVYVPMRTGAMYTVVTTPQDWVRLVSSRPAEKPGDFTMYAFGTIPPQELFKDFSPVPLFWAEVDVPRVAREAPLCRLRHSGRSRPGHSPVGGWKDWRTPVDEWVEDRLDFYGAVLEESALPPKRYAIDCSIVFTIGIRPTDPAAAARVRSRLVYNGPLPRGLYVFSRPIDDELVQLLILDLR